MNFSFLYLLKIINHCGIVATNEFQKPPIAKIVGNSPDILSNQKKRERAPNNFIRFKAIFFSYQIETKPKVCLL